MAEKEQLEKRHAEIIEKWGVGYGIYRLSDNAPEKIKQELKTINERLRRIDNEESNK